MGHAVADKRVYCHEALHLKQKLQSAGYKQAVEKWDTDSDSDESDDEADLAMYAKAESAKGAGLLLRAPFSCVLCARIRGSAVFGWVFEVGCVGAVFLNTRIIRAAQASI